jgi:hypothetical protein
LPAQGLKASSEPPVAVEKIEIESFCTSQMNFNVNVGGHSGFGDFGSLDHKLFQSNWVWLNLQSPILNSFTVAGQRWTCTKLSPSGIKHDHAQMLFNLMPIPSG